MPLVPTYLSACGFGNRLQFPKPRLRMDTIYDRSKEKVITMRQGLGRPTRTNNVARGTASSQDYSDMYANVEAYHFFQMVGYLEPVRLPLCHPAGFFSRLSSQFNAHALFHYRHNFASYPFVSYQPWSIFSHGWGPPPSSPGPRGDVPRSVI